MVFSNPVSKETTGSHESFSLARLISGRRCFGSSSGRGLNLISDIDPVSLRTISARADIDDRDEKVGRKIRDAEKEWINMIVVYGQKEKESEKLPVRYRDGEIKEFTIEELQEVIENMLSEYPFEGLTLPALLSKRPVFRG